MNNKFFLKNTKKSALQISGVPEIQRISEHKKILTVSLIALLIVFFDQLTKNIILKNFNVNQSLAIINNVFHLTFVKNTGAGFGILKGFNLVLILISIIVIGIIFFYINRIKDKEYLLQILIGFIVGVTIVNLINRIRLGYVIDFLDFRI